MTRLHLQEYYLLCCNFHRNFDFTDHFLLSDCSTAQSERPHNTPSATPVSYHTNEVWPLPLSLATTHRISVDFSSSPYLDVSVQAVPFQYLWIQYWIMEYELHWVAPFRYLRINGCLLLPEAFRSLPRLSSAPSAKAFTLRPF